MFLIADLSSLAGSYSTYEMSLCQLGIMGTEYVHAETQPTEITIEQGVTYNFNIPHITSALTIGNTLQINMR